MKTNMEKEIKLLSAKEIASLYSLASHIIIISNVLRSELWDEIQPL